MSPSAVAVDHRLVALACVFAGSLFLGGCGGSSPSASTPRTRTFRMGFSGIPPRLDQSVAIAAIGLWSRRADAAIVSLEPPSAELLAGTDPRTLVSQVHVPLAKYYRSKGYALWVYLDPVNGLNGRASRMRSSAPAAASPSPPCRTSSAATRWRWTVSSAPSTWG